MKNLNAMMYGMLVGDAVGVPYEFKSREEMDENPCVTMTEYGTHNQPIGTWSDDSTMALCLLESIAEGYSHVGCAKKYVDWVRKGYWTPHGRVFDIGHTTRKSLDKMGQQIDISDEEAEKSVQRCYEYHDERFSGNGALMRIFPFLLYMEGLPLKEQKTEIFKQCQMTHQSLISSRACYVMLKFAQFLDKGYDKEVSLAMAQSESRLLLLSDPDGWFVKGNVNPLISIMNDSFIGMDRKEIMSSGYVVHTAEAALWCIMNSDSYKEAVLKAVNLGDDTDTTAAVVGALAGLIWGFDPVLGIPKEWIENLVRLEDIKELLGKAQQID